jgi:Ca2+-binding RTX toxin-like protein
LTSLSLSGNNAAATYDFTAGTAALADVAVSGASDVTLKLKAATVASSGLNVVDSGAGTFTLDLGGTKGNVDLRGGGLIDKLVISVDEDSQTLSVGNNQVVTMKVTQGATAAATVAVGLLANAATNAVTIKLDDNVRDNNTVALTNLKVTQAKTVTIDGSIDTTSAGSANTETIKTLDASAANSNVTINMGVNNLNLAANGATTVGTGTITVTGSGTLTDDVTVTSLTAAVLDASAMTGAVTLDSTTTLAVGTIKTGSANDTVVLTTGTASDVTVQMNAGNDTLILSNGDYTNKIVNIDMGAGTDTVRFLPSTTLYKGSGVDTLAGIENIVFSANTTTDQGIQANLLHGQTYNILSNGSASTNNITVKVATTDTAVDLSGLVGSTATESSVAAMTFTTDASANTAPITIKGISAAKNIITGSSSADVLTGGAKDDTFNYSSASLLFSSGALLDTINGGAGTDAINLTSTAAVTVMSNDSWANATNVEKITTGANANAISLTLGATAQTAGITTVDLSGDNNTNGVNVVNASAYTAGITVTGSPGAGVDSITGGSGDDTFVYKITTDLVNGGAFIDSIVGGAGTDTIQLGDTLANTAANLLVTDSFARVSGVETIKSVATTAAESVALHANAYTAGIRTVDLSLNKHASANKIDASAITGGGMTLIGSATGATTILGGAGDDTITGGAGDDTITANAGNDSISAGAGDDTITMAANLTSADTIDGGAGSDTLTFTDAGGATSDLNNVTNIETITLGNAITAVTTVDTLVASGGTLTVSGNSLTGTNTLMWNGSAETNGKFSITGGAAADTIIGGAGADTITGGDGIDSLTGGAGADIFVYATGASELVTYAGGDKTPAKIERITDFVAGTDKIKLTIGAMISGITLAGTTGISVNESSGSLLSAAPITIAAGKTDIDALTAAFETAASGVASTVGVAGAASGLQVYTFTTNAGSGAFDGRTYLVINDGTAAIAATDTIIDITGVIGNISATDFLIT